MRQLEWVGQSKKELLALPSEIVAAFGYALFIAQAGEAHANAKALRGYTADGVFEVIENDGGGTYRAMYAAKIGDLIYVLHCFQKKSHSKRETPKANMNTLDARLKAAKEHALRASKGMKAATKIRSGETADE